MFPQCTCPHPLWFIRGQPPVLTLPCYSTDAAPVWTVPKSPSGEQLKNGGLTPLRSAEPSPALRKRSLSRGAEVRQSTSYSQFSPVSSLLLLFLSSVILLCRRSELIRLKSEIALHAFTTHPDEIEIFTAAVFKVAVNELHVLFPHLTLV